MATNAQKLARIRNWDKGQIINLIGSADRIASHETTTDDERRRLRMIKFYANNILATWNKK